MPKPIKVVFIGGCIRSGSTLLSQLLSGIDGFFHGGELVWIWEKGLIKNELCGCGKPTRECEFWQSVMHEMFLLLNRKQDLMEIYTLSRGVGRWRYIPYMLSPIKPLSYQHKFETYKEITAKLYKAIHEVTKARVILDSSKEAYHGLVLSAIPDIDLYIIHLVRDSRAVAFSLSRKKRKPEVYWKEEYMEQLNAFNSALHWNAFNIGTELLKPFNQHFKFLKYEDLVNDPCTALSGLLAWLGEPICGPSFIDELITKVQAHHCISGNPIRFQKGPIRISPDIEWRKQMKREAKLLVTVLTWPLLLRYGYIWRGK